MFFPLLPPALIALIMASPALAAPTSSNDPFKALSAHVVKPPELPVCCLRPLPSAEPAQEDVLLSFEEWKEKRFAMQSVVQDKAKEKEGTPGERAVEGGETTTPPTEVPREPAAPQDAPHFRVPITDRFNYASLDCSARVHTSHRSAKSPTSILSSKRDRYMLSPCRPKGEQQFVVVELCEDIRIDTVQLANFEFFSGVFKDFTVSVSKTYTTDPEGWTFASTHTAKNIRVVQSFHPPTSLRDFYRYIRIDFHSHYSNEYYCPISLLRVYGLTHLEEYKWEMWEQESRARANAQQAAVLPSPPLEEPEPEPALAPDLREREKAPAQEESVAGAETLGQTSPNVNTPDADTVPPSHESRNERVGEQPRPPAASATVGFESSASASELSASTTSTSTKVPDQTPPTKSEESSPDPKIPQHSSTTPDGGDFTSSAWNDATVTTGTITTTTTTTTTSTGTVLASGSGSTISVSALSTTSLFPAPAGGESIYRTIMNRLTALEANHTLYARYVEEHTSAVREMLRRVGEDLGRAEGVGKAQAQTYARTLLEWEKQRKRVDAEYRELMRRVEYLSDEIVLEKRLGIAQLLLLLAVLVFMTLTRGSRGEAVMAPSVSRSALRAWGRRNLSLKSLSLSRSGGGSGDWDWVARLRSRSRSPKPAPKPKQEPSDTVTPVKLEFPSAEKEKLFVPPNSVSVSKPRPPRLNLQGQGPVRPRSRTRSIGNNTLVSDQRMYSRTPTLARTPHRRPGTPTHAHAHARDTPAALPLPITHSVSQGAHAPRSARRWARTAHLHELRGSAQKLSIATTRERDTEVAAGPRSAVSVLSLSSGSGEDVFASPSPMPNGARSADLIGMGRPAHGSESDGLLFQDLLLSPTRSPGALDLARGAGASDGEGDMWVDTDGSEMGGDGDADTDIGMTMGGAW
ncbi:V-type proton ATPase proteolipid subunit [Mycena venus]|uniref:V-type proton ATPase proteolipid subunit n=1 Tax=Mycena venus TaxID=2733690 RepID=A0A8H6YVK9_9AGAR|nr:V-type proton ATPase proteolipid subunit [Mycena venus]